MDLNDQLTHFLVKANRDIGFIIEAEVHIWAENKKQAREYFGEKFPKYKIISVKKLK